MPRARISAERLEDDVDDRRREPERGLVEEEHVRARDERARDRELLLLAAGERARLPAPELLHDREQLVDRVDVLLRRPRRSRRPASPSRRFSSTVSSAKIRRPSGTSATPLRATPPGVRPTSDAPASRISPARGRDEAHDRVQRRRLAGAVRPDQPDDLAAPHLERQMPRTAATPP